MAVAFDAVSSAEALSASSLTFSHTCTGSDRYLTVGVNILGVGTVTGITYNGVAMTQLVVIQNTPDCKVEIWGLAAPATGANNVVVTLSGLEAVGSGAISFTGVDQSSSTSSPQTNSADSATSSSVTVTSATGDMVVDIVGTSSMSPTVGAGQTQRYTTSPAAGFGNGSTEAGAASVVMSWTFSSNSVAQAAVNIKQVSSSTGNKTRRALLGVGK